MHDAVCRLPRIYLLKLWGKSGWVSNRGPESRQEGAKEARSAASCRQRGTVEKPSAIFQTVSLGTWVNNAYGPMPNRALTLGMSSSCQVTRSALRVRHEPFAARPRSSRPRLSARTRRSSSRTHPGHVFPSVDWALYPCCRRRGRHLSA